jgi:radical SAM protein with 4Fe4S-binding SPASM domain
MFASLKKKAWSHLWKGVDRMPGRLAIESVVRVMPRVFDIEATNICNHRCPLCPNSTQPRQKGLMDRGAFIELAREIRPFASNACLSILGEGLLHPELFEMIAGAESLGLRCSLMTNGQLIDECVDEMLASQLTAVKISIDGADRESHERYRIGADFDRVRRGVELLCTERRRRGLERPHIRVTSLLFRHNMGQHDEIRRWAESIGADGVEVRPVWVGTAPFTAEDHASLAAKWLPDDPTLTRDGWVGKKQCRAWRVCPVLHKATILWNGDMVACGRCAWDDHEPFGNVFTDGGFRAVWSSDRHRQLLARVMRREFDVCRDCDTLDDA